MSKSEPESGEDFLLEAAELAVKEIHRRLRDKAADIPDHVLSKMVTDLNRFLERRDRQVEEEQRPFSLLDEISTLPPDRAKDLVEAHLLDLQERFDREVELYEQSLIDLGGSDE